MQEDMAQLLAALTEAHDGIEALQGIVGGGVEEVVTVRHSVLRCGTQLAAVNIAVAEITEAEKHLNDALPLLASARERLDRLRSVI